MTVTGEGLKANFPQAWGERLKLESVNWNHIADVLNECTYSPKFDDIFAAFKSVSPGDVKVVILGQDPYPTAGVAHGYSFSVSPTAQIPPSLRNIHMEIMNEYGLTMHPLNGSLMPWVQCGVLLLNTVLTVEVGSSNSHRGIGWEQLTSQVIEMLDRERRCVFVAWGNQAKDLCQKHVTHSEIVQCGHPSPLNTSKKDPFIGSNCFKNVNEILLKRGMLPIAWTRLWTVDRLQ